MIEMLGGDILNLICRKKLMMLKLCLGQIFRSQIYAMSSLVSTAILSDNLLPYSSSSIAISHTELNLKQTLLGGQSFRWSEHIPNEWTGVLGSYIIRLRHENGNLHYTFYTNISNQILSSSANDREKESSMILNKYFQFSVKLEELFEQWCKSDQRFAEKKMPVGIRVLAQDPLENLISFICSSNNNVQRITKMVQSFCNEYGKEIGTIDGITYHQFPTIDELDRSNLEERLRALNFGYRARYIQQAIKYLKYTINDSAFFDRLKALPVTEARIELLKIMGVGRKVADCVLLMSLDKQDVVPVDTHIHSIATTYYGQKKNLQLNTKTYDQISSSFEQLWKPFAGWAQAAAFSNELRQPMDSKVRMKRSISDNECQLIQCKKTFFSMSKETKEC